MAKNTSGKFSFESLNDEIRNYLAEVTTDEQITRALRKIQAAERRIAKITRQITRQSLDRAADAGYEIRDGVVREPAPQRSPSPPFSDTQALLSATDRELEQARNVQKKLLPTTVPELPGLDTATYSRFCRDVGGDYFDLVKLPDGRWGLIVADVSGKGVPAAMVMIMFRSIFRMVAANGHTATETLYHTNRLVQRDLLRGMFITAIYAVIDPETRKVTLVNAGHNPPFLSRPRLSGTRIVSIKGPAIGLLPKARFLSALRQRSLALEAGDCLCFYTDGATEAKNLLGDELEERGLARAFRNASHQPAQQTIDALVAAVDEHQAEAPQHDDITLVVLRAL